MNIFPKQWDYSFFRNLKKGNNLIFLLTCQQFTDQIIFFLRIPWNSVMSNDSVDFEKLPLDQVLSFRIRRLNATLMRQASLILAKESQMNLVEWRLLILFRDYIYLD